MSERLSCTLESCGPTVLIRLGGELTPGGTLKLAEVLVKARAQAPQRIVLDLAGLKAMDTAGLSFLRSIQAFSAQSNSAIEMHISGLTPKLRATLAPQGAVLPMLDAWMQPVATFLAHDPPPPAAAPGGPVSGGEWILVVDDDNMVRKYLNAYLGQMGYRVLAAGDEQEALDHLRGNLNKVSLALVDFRLGATTGLELVEQLTALQPQIRIILMSGLDDRAFASVTLPNIRKRVQKPVFGEHLLLSIREVLNENGGDAR